MQEQNIIAKRLKALRLLKNVTQRDLATILGVEMTTISKYEHGRVAPTMKTIMLYADYFNVSLDYIFGRIDNPQGQLFSFDPQSLENIEMRKYAKLNEFIDKCYDSNSPISGKVKAALFKIFEEYSQT